MSNNKEERIYFRIDKDIKEELKELSSNANFTLSEYLRNQITSLVNRKDIIESLVEQYQEQELKLDMFIEESEIDNIGSNDKDEIIYHCSECKIKTNKLKFTRKSNKFQSSFDVLKFGKGLLNCGEVLYLAVGSSSFYDTAFLRAIEYSFKERINLIEVIALTRSNYETITRSVLIADKVISKTSEYHISLQGIDIMMLRIYCVISQSEQIRRMNTTHSLKTNLFNLYLNCGEEKALWYYENRKLKGYKNFNDRAFELYKREYKALYELNNLDQNKFNQILKYLINTR
jgi:hypothetical protein